MQRQYFIVIVFVVFCLPGCYSYRIFPKEIRKFKVPAAIDTVYVENPQLQREFAILKSSGIYNITSDSTRGVKIRLRKMNEFFVCGNAFPGWLILGGQLPMYLPDRRTFSFEEIKGGDTATFNFELHVAKRFWFWDMFSFKKNFSKEAGKTLAAGYYTNKESVHIKDTDPQP